MICVGNVTVAQVLIICFVSSLCGVQITMTPTTPTKGNDDNVDMTACVLCALHADGICVSVSPSPEMQTLLKFAEIHLTGSNVGVVDVVVVVVTESESEVHRMDFTHTHANTENRQTETHTQHG